jgi:hypothetical protein
VTGRLTEKPLLMKGPLVAASLAGTKTQTRRPIPSPVVEHGRLTGWRDRWGGLNAPLGSAGPLAADRLWVRETWAAPHAYDGYRPGEIPAGTRIHYLADEERGGLLWRPSIHMPRWASRLTLEVTQFRFHRLQEITPEEARAEGAAPGCREKHQTHGVACEIEAFERLWDEIYLRGFSWSTSPWVWAATYRRTEAS